MPDVSLYKEICKILGITLNEFFSGEKLTDETFKKVADSNLLSILENSVFTLKDKIDFFKEQWQKEHFLELMILMFGIIFFMIYGFIKDNGLQYLSMIIGLISGRIENNKMMAYIERNVSTQKSKISMDEFRFSMQKLKEFKKVISKFENKSEAINYLRKETGLSKQECKTAYDFAMKNDFDKVK